MRKIFDKKIRLGDKVFPVYSKKITMDVVEIDYNFKTAKCKYVYSDESIEWYFYQIRKDRLGMIFKWLNESLDFFTNANKI